MASGENSFIYFIENANQKQTPLHLQKEGLKNLIYIFNEKALQYILTHKPDLVVFDFDSHNADYIELLHLIKGNASLAESKLVFITSVNDPYFELAAYEAGLDFYISKPKKNRLLYLVLSKLISSNHAISSTETSFENFKIDREKFTVVKQGKTIYLSKKEFELVELLGKKPGKVYTREEIAEKIWQGVEVTQTRTIDVHIRKLRNKLGNDLIKTIKGVGYALYIQTKA